MISAVKWARETNTPFLGVCLGMQLAVIEYARNVCGIPKADSAEFNEHTPDPIIISMPEISKTTLGGTMRLGLRNTIFQPGSEWSKLRTLYTKNTTQLANGSTTTPHLSDGTGSREHTDSIVLNGSTVNGSKIEHLPAPTSSPMIISERHRHRYEVNPTRIEQLTSSGLHFVGKDESGQRMEVVELKEHAWFVGVQFHPEYLSRVLAPSKPYLGFVAASAGVLGEVLKGREGGGGVSGLIDGMEGVRI